MYKRLMGIKMQSSNPGMPRSPGFAEIPDNVKDTLDNWCMSAAGVVHGLTSEPLFVDRDFMLFVTKYLSCRSWQGAMRGKHLAHYVRTQFESILGAGVEIEFVSASPYVGLFNVWLRYFTATGYKRFVFYSCLDGPTDTSNVVVCIRADNVPSPMVI